jgi:hypothetical protein
MDLEFSIEVPVVKLNDFLKESQISLTPEQAILKAKNGSESYKPMALGVLWVTLCRIYNPGTFQAQPSITNLGQLKHIIAKLGGVDVGFVMDKVIGNWLDFGRYLKDQGLVFDWPDKPNVGFLLKHITPAVEFSKQVSAPKKSGGVKVYESSE